VVLGRPRHDCKRRARVLWRRQTLGGRGIEVNGRSAPRYEEFEEVLGIDGVTLFVWCIVVARDDLSTDQPQVGDVSGRERLVRCL